MRKAISTLLATALISASALYLTASPVLAEEVLYCVDTKSAGLVWNNKGEASVSAFDPDRWTIKVVSETERVITRIGDTAGRSDTYTCKRPYLAPLKNTIVCDDDYGDTPWIFHRNTYIRAFLSGPPAGGGDPNSLVAYGTCTKW
jgi:hypothetical protein